MKTYQKRKAMAYESEKKAKEHDDRMAIIC